MTPPCNDTRVLVVLALAAAAGAASAIAIARRVPAIVRAVLPPDDVRRHSLALVGQALMYSGAALFLVLLAILALAYAGGGLRVC